jgi:hypothetical protein
MTDLRAHAAVAREQSPACGRCRGPQRKAWLFAQREHVFAKVNSGHLPVKIYFAIDCHDSFFVVDHVPGPKQAAGHRLHRLDRLKREPVAAQVLPQSVGVVRL